jgi:hypothetical protein
VSGSIPATLWVPGSLENEPGAFERPSRSPSRRPDVLMAFGVNTPGVGGRWNGQKMWRVGGPAKSAARFGPAMGPWVGPSVGFGRGFTYCVLSDPQIRRFYLGFGQPDPTPGSVWQRADGPTVGNGSGGRATRATVAMVSQPYRTNPTDPRSIPDTTPTEPTNRGPTLWAQPNQPTNRTDGPTQTNRPRADVAAYGPTVGRPTHGPMGRPTSNQPAPRADPLPPIRLTQPTTPTD